MLKIKTPGMSNTQKQQSCKEIQKDKLKTFDTDDKFWDDMDSVIEQAAMDNKIKASKK